VNGGPSRANENVPAGSVVLGGMSSDAEAMTKIQLDLLRRG
jgi:hypothetical protein